MKIYVYAICKNEEENVISWYESMKEADDIFVLDTGSTDNTVKLLKELNVHVIQKEIKPWRFDVARNESLKMVPKEADIYVCTDLDERFNPGWRKIIEQNYKKEYTRIKYTYNWSFKKDGKVGTSFYLNKIHTKDYEWKHPVHEVLVPLKEEKELLLADIILNHYQKEKNTRANYLPLLELSVRESPLDDRNMHYLGREYMYYKMDDKAIETLHKHLDLKSANWKDERSASMRFMARCYKNKKYYEEAILWYNLAIDEAPYLRESYVELATLNYEIGDYETVLDLLNKALQIKEKPKTYINEEFAWDATIYDLYAISAFLLNKKDIAIEYSNIAISMEPNNERIKNNNLFLNQNGM